MGGFTCFTIDVAPQSRGSVAMCGHDFFVEFRSVVRGYHIYKRVWTPVLGEQLSTNQEHGNPEYTTPIYHLFSKRRLNIIQVAVWCYI